MKERAPELLVNTAVVGTLFVVRNRNEQVVKMAERNLNRAARLVLVSFAVVVCLALLVACLGPSTSVKGTILRSSGETFAGRDVILIPVLAGDKVTVFAIRAGGAMKIQVPLDELGKTLNPGDHIMFETGGGGAAKWRTKTSDRGDFLIKSVAAGEYVLFQMIGGSVYRMRTEEGYIRIDVEEGETKDLGTITLRSGVG